MSVIINSVNTGRAFYIMYNIILVKRIFYLMILKVSNGAMAAVAMKPGPEDRWAWMLDNPVGWVHWVDQYDKSLGVCDPCLLLQIHQYWKQHCIQSKAMPCRFGARGKCWHSGWALFSCSLDALKCWTSITSWLLPTWRSQWALFIPFCYVKSWLRQGHH